VSASSANATFINKEIEGLEKAMDPIRKDILGAARKVLRIVRNENSAAKAALSAWVQQQITSNFDRYSSYLHSQSEKAALNVTPVAPVYADDAKMEDGRIILRDNFDKLLQDYPQALI